jgi:hypothetical protein
MTWDATAHGFLAAAGRQSGYFRIDEGAEAALAGVNMSVLVTLLVVASLLHLGNPRNVARFSIEAARTWGHSVALLRIVELLAYVSAVGGCLSITSMIVTPMFVGWAALIVTLIAMISFAGVCVLSIRWFWSRAESDKD